MNRTCEAFARPLRLTRERAVRISRSDILAGGARSSAEPRRGASRRGARLQ